MRLLLILLAASIYSCSTLQSNHSGNVKSFAIATKGLSSSPGELYQELSDYRHKLRLIESSTLFSSDKIIPRLNNILVLKAEFDNNAEQVYQACQLIDAYAASLLVLVDESYQKEFTTQADELSLRLNAALTSYNKHFNKQIPSSLGDFLGVVVNKIGSIRLKQLQKKYLKEFVDSGSLIIDDVCGYFTDEMARSLEVEMRSLDQQFENVMSNFYDNIEQYQRGQNINPFDYLKSYNPLYLEMKEKLTWLHLLSGSTVEAMKQIKSTHDLLKASVNSKLPLELVSELKELYATMQDIKSSYNSLKEK